MMATFLGGLPTLAGLTVGTAVAGNSAAVQAARASVHLEAFLWKDGSWADGSPTP